MIKSEFSARLEKLLAMTGDSMRDLAQKCDIRTLRSVDMLPEIRFRMELSNFRRSLMLLELVRLGY